MMYKLPEPAMIEHFATGDVLLFDKYQVQAAYAAGQRDMLERCVAACLENVGFWGDAKNIHPLHQREKETAQDIVDKLKELLNDR